MQKFDEQTPFMEKIEKENF